MQVGEIVMARQKGKLWPGRLTQAGVVVEVKFYRVKLPQKVPAKEVFLFSAALAQQAQAENAEKQLVTAIKQAEKEQKALMASRAAVVDLDAEEGNIVSDSQPSSEPRPAALNRSRHGQSLHVIKEEEDNVKQEEGEEERAPAACFSHYLDFLMAEKVEGVIADSRRNALREYSFLCASTRQPVTLHSYPRFLLLCLLQQFLHLAHAERNSKERTHYQRTVLSILNSGAIDLDVCVGTKAMLWVDYCLRGMKGKELSRTDQQFARVVAEFRTNMAGRFDNFLDDYTEDCRLAKSLTLIFKAFRK